MTPNAYQYDPGIYVETEWQPIETAPRDGTPFLTFSADARANPQSSPMGFPGTSMLVMSWPPYDREPMPIDECGDWHDFNNYIPTHWRPLPLPPAPDKPEPGTLITGEKPAPYNGQGAPEDALRENR